MKITSGLSLSPIALLLVVLPAVLFLSLSGVASGQDEWPGVYHREAYSLESGLHDGFGTEMAMSFRHEIRAPGAPWLRVHFGDYDLGYHSHITVTSIKDGGRQRLDARALPQWGNTSAYFNGDAVAVELHVAPGDRGVFFQVDGLTVGEWRDGAPLDPGIESLCGADSRAPSTDPITGRLTFVAGGNPGSACTAWLVSNGAVLTAGHCVDFDPDRSGPLLPDGVLDIDANDVVEFNPPASQANGTLVFAPPQDQYTIDLSSVAWNYDGDGQGLGKDWAVFDLFANANTGLGAHQAQGFFRMTNGNPAVNDTMRITGYGTDNTPNLTRNQVQQTHTGPYVGESSSGADIWHRYQVDTTGGNSGSPIIWTTNGFTVGIHTNAGCNPDGTGANSGTSFEHDPVENALQSFPSGNTVYVDLVRFGATENGTIFHPYDTVGEAVSAASSGAVISIVEGSYGETLLLGTDGKALFLQAPVGSVLIGN